MVIGAIQPGSLTLGTDHACIVDLANQFWCWGSNAQGQIKPGLASLFNRPFQTNIMFTVPAGTVVVGGGTFTCATFAPSGFGVTVGDTKCWGRAIEGQLGNASTVAPFSFPATAVQ
jgi:hypothetical protein